MEQVNLNDLHREIEEIREKYKPIPLFIDRGIKYYDPISYSKLLNYFKEVGHPIDYTPIEFNRDGSPKAVNPTHVVINVDAYFSNKVRVVKKGTKVEYHIVTDTRTLREAEIGIISLNYIPEMILTKEGNDIKVVYSTVLRDEFVKNYTESFSTKDMTKLLQILNDALSKQEENKATLEVPFDLIPTNDKATKK